MIITYFRSSSFNQWSYCQQQYYLRYVLGLPDKANKKAEKGTVVHKAMEVLAVAKKGRQEGKTFITDHICGRISTSHADINSLVRSCYDYYSGKSPNEWTDWDFKECKDWTWKALKFRRGEFDPRNQNIFEAEQRFDFEIDKPWARYEYKVDGKTLSGYLGLRGTIDLVVKEDEETLHIIDYKTGRRLDWATGKEKTYYSLDVDSQLSIYHYAVHKLFPQFKYIIITIYYINDGGPYTLAFDNSDLNRIENKLRNRFNKIKECSIPRTIYPNWKCERLCHYFKTAPDGSPNDSKMYENSLCFHIKQQLEFEGMERTTQDNMIGKAFDQYDAPGE
jgi:ATP-dependent helicase/DNAse subunit B